MVPLPSALVTTIPLSASEFGFDKFHMELS
jgi:hypothetical protein